MLRTSSSDGRTVVALVATTRTRRDLLLTRAVPSILAQTRVPDRLLVVIDQPPKDSAEEFAAVERYERSLRTELKVLCGDRIHVKVARNFRTRERAAGAWNHGIDLLNRDASLRERPRVCYVAVLDDDDSWEPRHIEVCAAGVRERDLDMVITGLIRHITPDDDGYRQSIPECLDPQQLFIKNPHVQGSNLFINLKSLMDVGLFDENLRSCTDRDLCIRLLDLPHFRYGSVPHHTVHHFADERSDRLTARSSSAKIEGLTAFWDKYADRFNAEVRTQALEAWSQRFGWTPPTFSAARATLPAPEPAAGAHLIVGFVSDSSGHRHARNLLSDLFDLSKSGRAANIKVVVLENDSPASPKRELRTWCEDFRRRGLDVTLVTTQQIAEDWARGTLIDIPNPVGRRLPIAVTRTILNCYVGRLARQLPGYWAWILDDDKRLKYTVDLGDGTVAERLSPDFAELHRLRASGVDVVIGPDTGAAPLPFTATIRVQLVDLLHHLHLLSSVGPDGVWPDRKLVDSLNRERLRDCYYDLSRQTEHLETPFTLSPPTSGGANDVLSEIGHRVDRLAAGEAIFRPLVLQAEDVTKPAADSVQRGGSTIFFEPKVLLEHPQMIARIGDTYVRRSDMLVAQLMRDQLGLKVVMHASCAVKHDRTFAATGLNFDTVKQDVWGYGLYRACDEVMQLRSPERRARRLLAWTDAELRALGHRVTKYVQERLASLVSNAARSSALAESIRDKAEHLAQEQAWKDERSQQSLRAIVLTASSLRGALEPEAIKNVAEDIRGGLTEQAVRQAFQSMDALISEYRASHGLSDTPEVRRDREERARELLLRFGTTADLKLLGLGGEGVVLTDGLHVYKVLDLLKRRPNHDTHDTLSKLLDPPAPLERLYQLARLEEVDGVLILAYAYEPSEPYRGGHGRDLIELCRECKRLGLVFRNMHPKNLRVAPSGVRLVDYGSDIRPYFDDGYRSMAQRAWLTWRWPHREDLDELMRRALVDQSLPELSGFENFWSALLEEKPSATRAVAAIVEPIVLGRGASSVLDYGCGKKAWSARKLAASGLRTIGYDPDSALTERWEKLEDRPAGLVLTSNREQAFAAAPFEAVICSLVLCELEDGAEYERVLSDLLASVANTGVVVVTFCNPFGTFGRPTPLHRRRDLPAGAQYTDRFWYTENAERKEGRREFHRPLEAIERDLLRHGLRVMDRLQSRTVDLERFEPASDFLTLVCEPVAIHSQVISLVIKTCVMEAHTIEAQVEHLVGQLEGPRTFSERLLVLDSLRDGFVRQHSTGEWNDLIRAGERLISRGFIDRVLLAPGPGAEAARINREWFDLESNATHSAAGAPLTAPLHAFEQCRSKYILQVDSDLLIQRRDRTFDYLGEMIAALETNTHAATASLNIPRDGEHHFTTQDAASGTPWRVEVRGCLLHRDRLLAARPYPSGVVDSRPRLSWHRAMDQAITDGRLLSLRGGGQKCTFVHPSNDLKKDPRGWFLQTDLIERGHLNRKQVGRVELQGSVLDWLPRERSEHFVFVITGRNVPAGRAMRCLETMAAQHRSDWGAVIIDDGSDPMHRSSLALALEGWRNKVTLLQPRVRRGQLSNMTTAIRHICTNPDSVIITLDLDDALIGPGVLDRLGTEYQAGADATVGSMLRTDKHTKYPIDLEHPRRARGGNVWQHLRSFRKRLFDAIPDHELRVRNEYPRIAVDWSFMLPIVEMARRPVHITEPLYLYEPSGMGKGADRTAREAEISFIVSRPRRRMLEGSRLLHSERYAPDLWQGEGGILVIRHAARPSFGAMPPLDRRDVSITPEGQLASVHAGRGLGPGIQVFTSPVRRSVETAQHIADAAGVDAASITQVPALCWFKHPGDPSYEAAKQRLGWRSLIESWIDGGLPDTVLPPCHVVAGQALTAMLDLSAGVHPRRVVAVAHDYLVTAILESVYGERTAAIPFLAGVYIPLDRARAFVASLSHALGEAAPRTPADAEMGDH